MSYTKTVDFGAAQTLHCQIMVDGEWADFDPTDSAATIQTAVEALSTVGSGNVTVTQVTAQRKWDFTFNFNPTTFSATVDNLVLRLRCDDTSGNAVDTSGQGNTGTYAGSRTTDVVAKNDLTFSNPAAIDLTGGSSFTTGVTSFPSGTSGFTVSFRFRIPDTPSGGHCAISFGETGAEKRIHIYPRHTSFNAGFIQVDSVNVPGYGYGTFAWPIDKDWHVMTVRVPTSGNVSDIVVYLDGVSVSFSTVTDQPIDLGTLDACRVGAYMIGSANPLTGHLDNILVFDNDVGDTVAKALNSYDAASTGCVLCLRCDEGTGTSLTDESSSNNDATFSGGWTTDTISKHSLTFTNSKALDISDNSYATVTNKQNIPTPSDGATIFIRFKAISANLTTSNILMAIGDGSTGAQTYIGYKSSYDDLYIGTSTDHSTLRNAALPWVPDENWNTLAIRIRDSVTLGHTPKISEVLAYLNGVVITPGSADPSDADIVWDTTNFLVGILDDATSAPWGGHIDQILIFRGDKGDTFAKALNTYNPSDITITITDSGGGVTYYRAGLMLLLNI